MQLTNLRYLAILLLFCANVASAQIESSVFVIKGGDGKIDNILKQKIEQNVSNFLTTFNIAANNNKTPSFDKNATTLDLRSRFSALWQTSPMICRDAELKLDILTRPKDGGFQIRNIRVDMLGAPEKDRQQEIVLNLTSDGKIDDVFIPVRQYLDLMNKRDETEEEEVRFMVLDFVENFRTAYNRKDIEFLDNIFSANALIIVGKKVVKLKNLDNTTPVANKVKWEMQVQSKTDYITGLKGVFSRNKYIDVKFDNISVMQSDVNPNIYGVQLKQVWTNMKYKKDEKSYQDTGYVFLMINYSNPKKPVITVRTWQPIGDIEDDDEIFGLGHFRISNPLNK